VEIVVPTETVAAPQKIEPAPVVSQAKVAAELAVQEFRRKSPRDAEKARKALDAAKTDAEYDAIRLAVEKRLAELAKPVEPVVAATTKPASRRRARISRVRQQRSRRRTAPRR
jgi:hypothetical protein